MKKRALFFLTLLLLLLSACGKGGGEADPTEGGGQTSGVPAEDEIRAMLERGEGGVYWAVDENDFARSEPVTVYSASPFVGDLWDALFSEVQVVSQEKFDDVANRTVLIDGQEYKVTASALEIAFYRMPARPALLEPETLLPALSGLTGTEWAEAPPREGQGSTKYLCRVDGLWIDDNGYFEGETLYRGPSVDMSDPNIGICVTLTLGAAGESIAASDLTGPELVEAVCTAYDRSALSKFQSQFVMVYDSAELRYYYEGKQGKLLPAFAVYGTDHYLADEGRLVAYPTSMLIDARTGEIVRGG